MSVVSNNILAGASGQGGGTSSGYEIERSIRLNESDSANLSRTPSSAGNRKTWTWSGWVKIVDDTEANIFNGGTSGSNDFSIRIDNGKLCVQSYTGSWVWQVKTTALFRDPSAWYHFLVSFDSTHSTSADRIKIYVNGVQHTNFSTSTYPSQNLDSLVNSTVPHTFAYSPAYSYSSFYLADVHFIDGQVLAPTDFGEFDDNNVWQPTAYSGSYGTNGFHLDFKNNSSNAALGTDTSGNSNTWTVNNFSVAAGAGNDSLRDSPSQIEGQTDSGSGGTVIGNYATFNPLNAGSTISNGNLDVTTTPASGYGLTYGTIGVSSGKWYFEMSPTSVAGATEFGIAKAGGSLSAAIGTLASGYCYLSNGLKGNNSSYGSYGATYTTGDVIGIALDLDAGTLIFYKNGVSQGTAFSGLSGEFFPAVSDSSNSASSSAVANFGQRAFHTAAPTGFKSLNTANLPTPTIADGSQYFDTKLYTGNGSGSGQSISSFSFSPDLVWLKARSGPYYHILYDIVRGVTKALFSQTNDGEATYSDRLTSFDSSGFTLGNNAVATNDSGKTYVSWAWDAGTSTVSNTDGSITSQVRANPSAGFSIAKYTGVDNSSPKSIGHGLNQAPMFVIIKNRTDAENWAVYHASLGSTKYIKLDSNGAAGTSSAYWNNTHPSSTVITVNNSNLVQRTGREYVAYCFAPVEGYSAFGSFTGNGSADGPFVYTGFRPAFMIAKRSSSSGDWIIHDTTRTIANGTGDNNTLVANEANAEDGYYNANQVSVDYCSNGFKIRHSGGPLNDSNSTYIYAAFAEHPFKSARAR